MLFTWAGMFLSVWPAMNGLCRIDPYLQRIRISAVESEEGPNVVRPWRKVCDAVYLNSGDVCDETSSWTNSCTFVPDVYLLCTPESTLCQYFLAARDDLFYKNHLSKAPCSCRPEDRRHAASPPSFFCLLAVTRLWAHIRGDLMEDSSCNMLLVRSAVFCHTVCSQCSNLHTKS